MSERHPGARQDEPGALVDAWLRASRTPDIAAQIEAIYQIVADQVAAHQPICVGSGRCCHFRDYGHLLYTTGLETAYAVTRLAAGHTLTPGDVSRAIERGDCPFLVREQCSVHTIKPSGCRIYFCDQEAEGWQQDLSERVVDQFRKLHDRHSIPYRYAEWRSLLAWFAAGSR